MPRNDNLYSADDSDDESLSEQLSPTNGYFTNRQHPQDMLVPNPSQNSSAAMSKEREAAEEVRNSLVAHAGQSETATPTFVSASNLAGVQGVADAVLEHGLPSSQRASSPAPMSHEQQNPHSRGPNRSTYAAPPPAYSPPTHRVAPSQSLIPCDYNTFLNRDLERAPDVPRAPESMGGPTDDTGREAPTETAALLVFGPGKRGGRYSLRRLLMVLSIVASCLGFLLLTIGLAPKKLNGDNHKPPITAPRAPDSRLPQHGPHCSTATIHLPETPEYKFPTGGSLTVLQVGRDTHSSTTGTHVNVAGRITIRRMNESLTVADNDAGKITIDQWASHHALGWNSVFDSNLRTLRVEVDRYASSETGTQPCMSLDITIWLPFQSTFTTVTILTWSLDIRVQDDVEVLVDGDVNVQSLSGSIHYPRLSQSNPGFWKTESQDVRATAESEAVVDRQPQASIRKIASTTTPLATVDADSDLFVAAAKNRHHQQVWPAYSSGIRGRRQIIKSGSSSIQGTFSLYDVLDISSQSGSIDIAILPQAVDPQTRHPAVLTIETSSGSIHAMLPVYTPDVLPLRDYQTRVTSNSGSVKGDYLLADSAVFQSNSGSIEVTCLPGTGHAYQGSLLRTSGYSGQHKVKLLSPPKNPLREYLSVFSGFRSSQNSIPEDTDVVTTKQQVPHDDLATSSRTMMLRNLKSTHVSSSGSVHVHYASEWEGQIDARSTSGSLTVGGEDVQITKDNRKNGAYKQISAIKGLDPGQASDAEIHSVSGQVYVRIGRGCDEGGWCP